MKNGAQFSSLQLHYTILYWCNIKVFISLYSWVLKNEIKNCENKMLDDKMPFQQYNHAAKR